MRRKNQFKFPSPSSSGPSFPQEVLYFMNFIGVIVSVPSFIGAGAVLFLV